MPYTAWAWRVLTGDTLADKLAPPSEGDRPPMRSAIPDVPGRPAGLAFPARGAAARSPFPAAHTLHLPESRGRALHFFANHELLALELMALAIVRFPEAPAAFRRGLVGVMADEQRHLAGYLARMEGSGVRFGDLPVNRYFWDALADAPAVGLIAGLSLTFEQANLDFAAHYAEAFRRAGDADTAAVLDEVLADEVRHVRHGLAWFDKWRAPDLSRWEAWVGALPPPLTPARAKGTRFFRAPREAAGLDADTIARLEGYAASRGRPPVVYSFHPEVEAEVAGVPSTATGARVARDLAGVLVFVAKKDDLVLAPRAPTPGFLAALARAGFALPEVVEGGPERLSGRAISGFAPWGRSPVVCAALTTAAEGAVAAEAPAAWDPRQRALYEKSWAVERLRERPDLCDPAVVGVVCRSWEEVIAAVAYPAPHGHVLKAPLGTAGRGMRRWPAPAGDAGGAVSAGNEPGAPPRADPTVEAWARGILATQGALVVEPWLDRVIDLSVQIDVGPSAAVRVAPWGRFLSDGRGRYRGAILGDTLRGEPPELRRLLAERGERLVAMAEHVGAALAAEGFSGPAGIDALVYRAPDGLALKPLVEVNPRMTMGRVARAIGRRVRHDRVGLWTQVSRDEVRAAGFSGFPSWASALRERAPLTMVGEPPLLAAGVLFTTDPDRAERLVTVLAVGGSLEECRALLGLGR